MVRKRRIGEDTFSVISLINMRNNGWPKTVPCGTPDKTGSSCDEYYGATLRLIGSIRGQQQPRMTVFIFSFLY